jgi:hypothetical protein
LRDHNEELIDEHSNTLRKLREFEARFKDMDYEKTQENARLEAEKKKIEREKD